MLIHRFAEEITKTPNVDSISASRSSFWNFRFTADSSTRGDVVAEGWAIARRGELNAKMFNLTARHLGGRDLGCDYQKLVWNPMPLMLD